ncbi:probable salivary secreted peptide [Ctenocephalides felis]|uniref:probable salivary secreted peptide n=1 Tax=Ctenocephalides felis TaxID=7515 RepID=UPI000E6E5B36|nr:probable salivary secreted peptide [Ctenocephalides felis]
MAYNKLVLGLAAIAVLVAAANCQSHNMLWGQRTAGDRLLFNSIEYEEFKPLQVVKRDVKFPKDGQFNYATITCINATDQYVNDNGGYISLLEGGVNYNHTTLHIKSQRNHGFNL